jgi:hypothetical protein
MPSLLQPLPLQLDNMKAALLVLVSEKIQSVLLARMQVNHWVILGQLILVLPMLLMLLAPNPQGLLVLAKGRVRPDTT